VGKRDKKVSNFTKPSNENLPIEIRSRTRSGDEIRTQNDPHDLPHFVRIA